MKKKDFIKNLIISIIPMVLVFPLSIFVLSQFAKTTYDCFFVVGDSMNPNLSGNRENSTYGYSDNSDLAIDNLNRFDLVICYYPFSVSRDYEQPYVRHESELTENATLKVKRVIGLPGERLVIDNDLFTIFHTVNGESIAETYGTMDDQLNNVKKCPFDRKEPIQNRQATITLGSEEYFVMGDNWTKDGSSDCCNPSSTSAPQCIYRENIDGVIIRLDGECTYRNIKHCKECKKKLDDDAEKCSCGSKKFKWYDDIVEERPYEDGPIYLK